MALRTAKQPARKPEPARRPAPREVVPETHDEFPPDLEPTQQLPAVQEELPAYLSDYAGEDEGEGLSTDVSDNLIPRILLLQTLSPQCKSTESTYIEGAEPGMLFIRSLPQPLIEARKGKVGPDEFAGPGIVVQVCFWSKDIVEWVPRTRGGGFVASHPLGEGESVPEAMARLGGKPQRDQDNPRRQPKYKNEDGNELTETRNFIFLVHLEDESGNFTGERMGFAVSMISTQHTFARDWMTRMNNLRIRNAKGSFKPPIYFSLWRLTTTLQKNTQGSWFGWQAEHLGFVKDPIEGKELRAAFISGEKRIEEPDDQGVAGDDGGDNYEPTNEM